LCSRKKSPGKHAAAGRVARTCFPDRARPARTRASDFEFYGGTPEQRDVPTKISTCVRSGRIGTARLDLQLQFIRRSNIANIARATSFLRFLLHDNKSPLLLLQQLNKRELRGEHSENKAFQLELSWFETGARRMRRLVAGSESSLMKTLEFEFQVSSFEIRVRWNPTSVHIRGGGRSIFLSHSGSQ